MTMQGFEEYTTEVIEELKSENPDSELVDEYSSELTAFANVTSPLYAEKIFESLLDECYENARSLARGIEENEDEIHSNSWNDEDRLDAEDTYERTRNARVRFLFGTVGEIKGYNWDVAREEGVI